MKFPWVRTVIGAYASLRWIVGAPFACLRIVLFSRDKSHAQSILAQLCQRALDNCGFRLEVTGTPPKPGQACVVTYNETSLADVMSFGACVLKHLDRSATANEYARFPFARRAGKKVGLAFIPRGNREGTELKIREIEAEARAGACVGWGGEGRLSGRDGVDRFKIGGSLLAIRAQVPILPVASFGGHYRMALGSLRANPGPIRIHFGDLIPTTGLTEDDARDLADRVQAVVAAMYEDLRAVGDYR